jgi:quercetin dioxygenase-like cupin family protein
MEERKTIKAIRWDDMPKEYLNDHIDRRIISGDRAMIAHVYIKKDGFVPMHQHDNEQITYIPEGSMKFWFYSSDTEPVTINAGEVFVIPANVPHEALALEDTLDIDIFAPPRQDWLNKTDDYLRGK